MNIGAYTALLVALFGARPLPAQTIPFDICTESATWTRPTPQMQGQKVWNDPRYASFGRTDYAWSHNFLVIEDSESPKAIVTSTNLSGLWTVKQLWLHKCYLDKQGIGVDSIEV